MDARAIDVGTRKHDRTPDLTHLTLAVNEFVGVGSRVACESERYRAALDGEAEWDPVSDAARTLGLTPVELEVMRARVLYSDAVRRLATAVRELKT